ncbi:anti-sigma factor family protein [Pseudonocardia kunmingensis]|uniref:Putative zinc finger protein n=1 Tax=Pseudonocardia kunmingensis TaxID=630975 RepID=A0A543CZ06_9PSEU|nr:zf-HC2 domain-containing protein [Pseudonocardia kunmingensis]TQM02333.1 putative zinc finger protein [Pseudonocardia kunmingensis]
MSSGRWRISVTTPDWGHDHLSSDAIVAYVDDELAPGPQLRATQHLSQCRECAAQVVAQGQARAALRTADCPSLPTSLLSSLRSIPQDTDLPAPPAGLAVTPEGQFVSVLRPERVAPQRSDTFTPSVHGRRPHRGLRLGTGVAVSGLAIGAIAFALPTAADGQPDPVPSRPGEVRGGAVPVDARLQLPPPPQAPSATPTPVAPTTAPPLDHVPGPVPDRP